MTDKQAHLVRDLRSFESPVCMEAAGEIERLAERLGVVGAGLEAAILDRERQAKEIAALYETQATLARNYFPGSR